eukprot:Gb_15347 [translate_table: standard]
MAHRGGHAARWGIAWGREATVTDGEPRRGSEQGAECHRGWRKSPSTTTMPTTARWGRLSKNSVHTGEILVNGRKRTLSYGTVAYVTQEDTLIGTLTVRESIHYSAYLRLPDKMPKEEKMAIVESTIMEMGLQDCADTPIGNLHRRGLSGGEKKAC